MNKKYLNIYALHFGKILFNYSILGIVLLCVILLSPFAAAFYYAIAFTIALALIIVTFGTIFVNHADLISSLISGGDNINKMLEICFKAFPYLLGITIGFSVIALVIACVQKEKKMTVRIVVSSIILALCVAAALIFYLVGGVYVV